MSQQTHPRYDPALRRLESKPAPVVSLVVALLPLLGVLALDWPVASMLGFYWIESVAIGVFHWLKMLAARGRIEDPKLEQSLAENDALTAEQRAQQLEASCTFMRTLMPGLFVIHYGLFCAAHVGIIVFLFDGAFSDLASALGLVTFGAIVAAHALDYARFRADPEFIALPRNLIFMLPYQRVIILQLVLLLGAIPVQAGYPVFTAFLLTAIKLVVELEPWKPRKHII